MTCDRVPIEPALAWSIMITPGENRELHCRRFLRSCQLPGRIEHRVELFFRKRRVLEIICLSYLMGHCDPILSQADLLTSSLADIAAHAKPPVRFRLGSAGLDVALE